MCVCVLNNNNNNIYNKYIMKYKYLIYKSTEVNNLLIIIYINISLFGIIDHTK